MYDNFQSDFLVIGSGIAGLNFALQVSKYGTVAIVTKKELMESNSNYAQGGIAAVLDKHDSFKSHIKDTLTTGCFINDKKAVEVLVKNAPKQIEHLINVGVGFSRENGKLCLTKEGGHSERRIAYVNDATGKEIERALLHQIRHHKNISTFESHIAFDLLIKNKKCIGALVFDTEKNEILQFSAKATIIATGGAGQVYSRNCNPKIATGDGVAMAASIGAKIRDMEFIQFHPTALALKNKPAFLISETVRGEDGILKNKNGKEFMDKYHKLHNLAPRDIVSRAIFAEMKKNQTNHVFLDIRHKGSAYIKKRFPYIFEKLWWFGIKMDKNMIPVAPAVHYICGGIHTDTNGETNIPGLYAFGEVAHTGVHGANRLASNSLLECLVFSDRAIRSVAKYIENELQLPTYTPHTHKVVKPTTVIFNQIKNKKRSIQKMMWNNVGIVREEKKMKKTLKKLLNLEIEIEKIFNKGISAPIIELRNINRVAILITKAALERKESIGCHYRLS
ncbi:MAG: L-aspartate oxidase [Candidatus Magasanikbacteria bacterium CG_4_10_14_0_2_um_filter_37_12]|uniref:L-aspartate oxidase n=1 Tax=Candidatus Magasanikbacteria bacterium CG_4_10_14_0_2_um_filter_37_12 TaxID=1974637 RepID=A0A2M7V8I0_9BACT|nr:MAG: L-aspartate oxidase [Candidatus Magasanikbacteria bacterium CG_4_10_14_0_2_um_filter_37_12]